MVEQKDLFNQCDIEMENTIFSHRKKKEENCVFLIQPCFFVKKWYSVELPLPSCGRKRGGYYMSTLCGRGNIITGQTVLSI